MAIHPKGTISLSALRQSPKAIALYADLLDRLKQHSEEDTLPRGPRGLFYDLRPAGMPGNPRGLTYAKQVSGDRERDKMPVTPGYLSARLADMRRVWSEQDGWLVNEDWISDSHAPDPVRPSEQPDAQGTANTIKRYLERIRLDHPRDTDRRERV